MTSSSHTATTRHPDIAIYAVELSEAGLLAHEFVEGRRSGLNLARGIVRLNDDELRQGNGARIEVEPSIELDTDHRAEILLLGLE